MARRAKQSQSVATIEPEANGNPEPRRLILLEIDPFNPPFPECHVEYRQADDECDEPHYVVTECVAGRRGNYPGLANGEPFELVDGDVFGIEATAPESANGDGAASPRRLILTAFSPSDPPFEPCVAVYSPPDDECEEPHWKVTEPLPRETPPAELELATLRAKCAQADEDAERRRKSLAEVVRLGSAAEDASDRAKRARKAYEAAVDAHFELEAQLDSPQQRLPFPPDEDVSPGKPVRVDEADDEEWRTVWLGSLDIPDELPENIVDKLTEANIRTVGELSDYLKPSPSGYVRRLNDIPGIGPAKVERIEQALDQFWAMRSEFAPATVAADEPEAPEDDPPGDDGAEGGAA